MRFEIQKREMGWLTEYVSDSTNVKKVCTYRDAIIVRMNPYMQYILIVANGFQQSNIAAATFNAASALLLFLIVRYSPSNALFNILTGYVLIYTLRVTNELPYTRSLLSEPVRNITQRDDAVEYLFSFLAIVSDRVDSLGIFHRPTNILAIFLAIGVMSLYISIHIPVCVVCLSFAIFPFIRPLLYEHCAWFKDVQAAVETVTKYVYEEYSNLAISDVADSLRLDGM
ncbi:Hypothetical protein DHA2_13622 [Giardia duodenalis]|nr:Hypothetical protein DHA2_13622 [Giardia intestinalis]